MNRLFRRTFVMLAGTVLVAGGAPAAAGPVALAGSAHDLAALAGAAHMAGELHAVAGAAHMAGELHAVAAVSSSDVWAVGCSGSCNGPDSLILHWNGAKWSTVASPDPGAGFDELTGVSVVSARNAWAVGYDCTTANCLGTDNVTDTLILHWNGSTWSAVTIPDPSSTFNYLSGVSAVSAGDVWASGSQITRANESTLLSTTLMLHWNGSKWSAVGSPNVSAASNTLYGVSASSATSAWAVGDECAVATCPYPGYPTDTITLHWNGTKWSLVSSPSPGGAQNGLFGVSALSANDAWAVGDTTNTFPGQTDSLILHWNGTAWSRVASANPSSAFDNLNAVSAASASDIWAAGNQLGASLPYRTLTERWSGSAWTAVASPDGTTSGTGVNLLAGVTALSSGDAVAVGWAQGSAGAYQVLILRWNGMTWSMA
jgi:hypothetical protein